MCTQTTSVQPNRAYACINQTGCAVQNPIVTFPCNFVRHCKCVGSSVVDLGFPTGGASIPEGGTQTYYFANFFYQKLQENERNLAPEDGRASPAQPLPPRLWIRQ